MALALICPYLGISEAEYRTVLAEEVKAIEDVASEAKVNHIAMLIVQKRHPYRLVYEAAKPTQSEKELTYLNPVPGNNILMCINTIN